MKRSLFFLFLLTCLTVNILAAGTDDNIYIAERIVTCRLSARDGRVSGARISQNYRMGARRVAGTGMVIAFYDRNSTVDHAGATGGKPQYRAWENGDIFYSGTRVCLLPVDVKPGKISKADIEVSYRNPEYLDDIMLMSSLYDIDRQLVRIHIPAEVAGRVTVDLFNGTGREQMTRDTDDKGNITVTVTLDSIRAFRPESLMPETQTVMPLVRVNAAFADLDELYGYLKARLESHGTVSPEIAGLAASIAAEAGTDTLARIDAVARWVRENIRYVAIEHGELAHKPAPAAEVLANRFGDCKGSANLICALLHAMGIDGRRVWIGTRGGIAAPFSVTPTLGGANHMIAAAVTADSTIFVDGTASNAPRGLVPRSIAGQECMIENGDTYTIAHVGAAYPGRSALRQTGRLKIDGSSLLGDMRYDMDGEWRCMIEPTIAGVTAARRPQLLAAFLSQGRKGVTVEGAELLAARAYDADTSTIVAAVRDGEAVKAVNGRSKLYVMPRLLRMAIPRQVDARDRKWPVDCSHFMPVEADALIEVPEGYIADGLPLTVNVDNPWFEGHVTYRADGDRAVRCTAALSQRRTQAEAAEVRAWNNAVREVEKASNTALVLRDRATME